MSAADLFANSYDVEFRLQNTWIVVGKMPLFIRSVGGHPVVAKVILGCRDLQGREYAIPLGKLPLSAMTNCPWGYCEGMWFAHGPARHRFQGLKQWSFWVVMMDGSMRGNDYVGVEYLLPSIINQPAVNTKPVTTQRGVITRDVSVTMDDYVLIRGVIRGKYSRNRVLLDPKTPNFLRGFLDRAYLDWVEDESEPAVKVSYDNPCTEIALEPLYVEVPN